MKRSEEELVSRRELLRSSLRATAAGFAALLGLPSLAALLSWARGSGSGRWYEVVQDRKDGHRWHVNLFAAKELGDLKGGRHLGRRVVKAEDIGALKQGLEYPARFYYRDGRKEQTF